MKLKMPQTIKTGSNPNAVGLSLPPCLKPDTGYVVFRNDGVYTIACNGFFDGDTKHILTIPHLDNFFVGVEYEDDEVQTHA